MPYRIISNDPAPALEELRRLPAMPSFYMEDYHITLGDYPIVGHLPLEEDELDFLPSITARVFSGRKSRKYAFNAEMFFGNWKELNRYRTATIFGTGV